MNKLNTLSGDPNFAYLTTSIRLYYSRIQPLVFQEAFGDRAELYKQYRILKRLRYQIEEETGLSPGYYLL